MAQANQARLVFVLGVLMICGAVAACVAPGTYAPYAVQGAAEAPEAASVEPVRRNEQCRPGERLTPEWHAELSQRWNQVAVVQATRRSHSSMSAALACTTVHGFLENCPAWDDRAPAWQVETCATALREDLAAARARADAYLNGSEDVEKSRAWLLGTQTSDIWQPQGRPGNLLMSQARLGSLQSRAPEHIALLDEARAFTTDAFAIAEAKSLLESTPSSCEGLALIEKHALHRNRYAAAILSRAVAARRLAVLAQLRQELDELSTRAVPGATPGTTPGATPEATINLERLRTDAQRARGLATSAACHDQGIARAAGELAARIEQDIAAENARQAARAPAEQASPAEEEPPASHVRPRRREVERRAPEPDWADSGGGCCKVCSKGKACGDSCIARHKVCRKGPGCACD